MKNSDEIRSDFDAIAVALARTRARTLLTHSERALLRHTPLHARSAIDVGCGDGVVARALAQRGLRVTALDRSPRHGEGEVYLTPTEVGRVYPQLLAGVELEHHADWRYSAIWAPGRHPSEG